MGLLRHRTVRATAAGLLIAGALSGAAVSAALAADPATVHVTGTLVDDHGAPLAGVRLVIEELVPPDGGIAGFQVTTDAQGAFAADLEPWGTAETPAKLTISTPSGDLQTLNVVNGTCTDTFEVTVSDERDAALADGPIAPLEVRATVELLGQICGTTATPRTNAGGQPAAQITPPPTNTMPVTDGVPARPGPSLVVGFVLGLLIAIGLLTPRPRGRRQG